MNVQEQWLTGEEATPDGMLATVELCRTFMNSEVDTASIETLTSDAWIAIAAVLAKRGDGTRIQLLQSVRSIRKAIGKTLHRLHSEGYNWNQQSPTKASLTYSKEQIPSYLSVAHPSGSRFLVLCDRHPNGSMSAVYGLASETEGLNNFVAMTPVSRSRIRKLVNEVDRLQNGLGKSFLVEADPTLVRTRFQQAVQVHRRLGKPFPPDYQTHSDLIRGPTIQDTHPILDLIQPLEGNWLARGTELFGQINETTSPPSYRMGAVDRPVMDRAWTRTTQQRLQNAMNSPVLINDAQRKEHVLAELDRIVDETFDESFRKRMSDRMLDASYVLWRQGDQPLAHVALATANALDDTNCSPLNIPWAKEALTGVFDVDGFVETFGSTQDPTGSKPEDSNLIIPK